MFMFFFSQVASAPKQDDLASVTVAREMGEISTCSLLHRWVRSFVSVCLFLILMFRRISLDGLHMVLEHRFGY